MTKAIKLIAVGNSTGIILSKDVLAHLGVERGDVLTLSEVPGGLELRVHDPAFAAQMETAREVMRRRRRALHELVR